MLNGLKFLVTSKYPSKKHQAWKRIVGSGELAIEKQKPWSASTNVFVLGSCFANEIRHVLERTGVAVHPESSKEIGDLFDDRLKLTSNLGEWNEKPHYGCFTPFSIHQEILIAFDLWKPSDQTIFKTKWQGETVYADPYRRAIFARTREDALSIRRMMNVQIVKGIERSEVLIFTLGLVEAFQLNNFGGYLAEYNSWMATKNLTLVNGTYESVHNTLSDTLAMIHERYPNKEIVLTVSPIPLARTFSNSDVITASMRGKSILYACADSLSQANDRVHYWPSYDYVMWSGDAFQEDLRHVRASKVAEITSAFCAAYFGNEFATKAVQCSDKFASGEEQPEVRPKKGLSKFWQKLRRAA